MGYNVVVPVGDNLKALFVGIKEFPTEKIYLLSTHENLRKAKKLVKKLDEFTIDSEIIELENPSLEEMFKAFGKICSKHNQDEIIVNVATGDRMSTCTALSASFANGFKAFGVSGKKAMMLPIMKLSYYNELSENKLKILESLSETKFISFQELHKKLGISISLLSYHINGNYKYKGLEEYRLVITKERGNNMLVKLSEMGNLLLKGYIKPESGNKSF